MALDALVFSFFIGHGCDDFIQFGERGLSTQLEEHVFLGAIDGEELTVGWLPRRLLGSPL